MSLLVAVKDDAVRYLRGDADALEQLLDAATDGIFAFDDRCRITFWNRAMHRITGLGPGEVLGRQVNDALPLLSQGNGGDTLCAETLAGSSPAFSDQPLCASAAGAPGHFDVLCTPLYGSRGEVLGGKAVVRDVREQVETAGRIDEVEGRFRTMADCAPVLLWMAGTDALCDFFNQSWLEFTGRTLEEEKGVGWAEGVHPEEFQRSMDTFIEAFNARREFKMVYRLRRHDGEYRWILDNGVPRHTPHGQFAGYIGSCIDITDRIESERHRERLVTQLEESLRAREEFISIASHELKTPLTSLKLHTQRLERMATRAAGQAVESDKLLRLADASNHGVQRLERLIDDMLSLSRLNHGGLVLQPEEMDLSQLARGVTEHLSWQLERAGCALTVDAASPVTGNWDAARLEQVLVNLLVNAIKYAPGKPVTVTVRTDDTTASLIVRDRGPGIAAADQARIFECFERAVPEKNVSGLGLGLYIVQKFVTAHAGTVRVTSEDGDGATFTVELPRNQAAV